MATRNTKRARMSMEQLLALPADELTAVRVLMLEEDMPAERAVEIASWICRQQRAVRSDPRSTRRDVFLLGEFDLLKF